MSRPKHMHIQHGFPLRSHAPAVIDTVASRSSQSDKSVCAPAAIGLPRRRKGPDQNVMSENVYFVRLLVRAVWLLNAATNLLV